MIQRGLMITFVRYMSAILILIFLAAYSAPIIGMGSFAGWMIAFPLVLITTVLNGLLAPRFSILFGLLSGWAVVFSLAIAESRRMPPHEINFSRLLSEHPDIYFLLFVVATLLSIAVLVPIVLYRETSARKAGTQSHKP